jgi:hypothetical protein
MCSRHAHRTQCSSYRETWNCSLEALISFHVSIPSVFLPHKNRQYSSNPIAR